MRENRGADSGGAVATEIAVRCVADDCDFGFQLGVFEGAGETLLPTVRNHEDCPACGATVEQWTPEFLSAAPGRPTDW
jgi:hypothetical protein